MVFVLSPGFTPVFAFTKDVLLYLGIAFMAFGLSQIAYDAIHMRQLRSKKA